MKKKFDVVRKLKFLFSGSLSSLASFALVLFSSFLSFLGGFPYFSDFFIFDFIDYPYAYLIHGHNHSGAWCEYGKMNVCCDVIGYSPINFNQFLKSGKLKEYKSIERETIDKATERAQKRGKRHA